MVYEYKSPFSASVVKTLDSIGCGKLISIHEVDGNDCLIIDMGPMEIPQYPINPVMVIEQVCIIVRDKNIPLVYCRDDFPVVPHLNVLPDGHKTLCLFDVSFEEIKYSFNVSMFLHQIVWWFEQTARGKLHQADQPLEPFFPGARDGLILNAGNNSPLIRLKRIDAPSGTLFQEVPLESKSDGKIYTLLKVGIKKTYTQNVINKMPTTLGELDAAFDDQIIDNLDGCIPEIWAIKQTPLFKQFFQEKEANLRSCEVLLAVQVGLARSENEPPEQFCMRAFRLADNFQSLYQAFGYQRNQKRKLVKSVETEAYKDIPIDPYNVLFSLTRSFAFHLNEGETLNSEKSFVQIGLGALGSQIANNCIRSGYGKWVYIDPDVLYPHNLARHCLNLDSIGQNKAQAMQIYANSLFSNREEVITKAIPFNVFDPNALEEIITAVKNSSLVVDCSASVAVGRYLSNELAGNTRAVSFFMNPAGTALIMLLENADRSISLDTLEIQYYHLLTQTPELQNHLKSDHEVLYSSTCRGTSLVYPQDNAAIFAGISSKVIKQIDNQCDAAIMVWDWKDLSMTRYEETAEKCQEILCDGWNIKVLPSLMDRLYCQRKEKLPNETGGVLIGSYDFAHNICYIVDAIDSPSDSKEYPDAYIRGSNGLYEKVCKIENITIGNLTYIGEWHSHPADSTYPSADDIKLLQSIADYTFSQSSPGCMMIVGENHYSIYLKSI